MGAVAALKRTVAPPTEYVNERRTKRRYPIHLDVQYKVLKHRRIERLGCGRTVNISSGGLLFEADDALPDSGPIEVALTWPFLLHGSCNLKLVVRGRIVRANERWFAVRADFHEFRTAGANAKPGETPEAKPLVRVMTA